MSPLLVRCSQPDADGFDTLRKIGCRLIYKLNTPAESNPADEAKAFVPGNVQQLPQFSYTPTVEMIKGIVDDLDAAVQSGIGVAIHCTHGRDRTGFLSAAYRILKQGWEPKAAVEEMKRYGASGIFELADAPFIVTLEKLGG